AIWGDGWAPSRWASSCGGICEASRAQLRAPEAARAHGHRGGAGGRTRVGSPLRRHLDRGRDLELQAPLERASVFFAQGSAVAAAVRDVPDRGLPAALHT